jgi:hypothetical protein
MTGVGKIYEMYRSGILESDDEVAVTFDAETMESLSVPLVNVRATLELAVETGAVTGEMKGAILETTKKLFYPDRNYRNIVEECVKKGIIKPAEKELLLDLFKNREVDIKREDALLVLETVKKLKN